MKHLGLDNILRDKETGKLGGVHVEIVATLQSLRGARKVQDEMASRNEMTIVGYDKNSAIYQRDKDGLIEELTIDKKGFRQWRIIKTLKQEVSKA